MADVKVQTFEGSGITSARLIAPLGFTGGDSLGPSDRLGNFISSSVVGSGFDTFRARGPVFVLGDPSKLKVSGAKVVKPVVAAFAVLIVLAIAVIAAAGSR